MRARVCVTVNTFYVRTACSRTQRYTSPRTKCDTRDTESKVNSHYIVYCFFFIAAFKTNIYTFERFPSSSGSSNFTRVWRRRVERSIRFFYFCSSLATILVLRLTRRHPGTRPSAARTKQSSAVRLRRRCLRLRRRHRRHRRHRSRYRSTSALNGSPSSGRRRVPPRDLSVCSRVPFVVRSSA